MTWGRYFFYLFVAGCIFWGNGSAWAANKVLDVSYFKEIFTDLVKRDVPWQEKDLVVENFSVMPEKLVVPEGRLSYSLQSILHPRYLGKKVVRLLMKANGRAAGAVKMTGDLQLYGEVVCLKRNLSRHEILVASDLEVVRRNISSLGADLITVPEEAVGQRLRSSLRAGSVLTRYYLEPPPLVERGDLVTITVQSDRFTISAPGEVRGTATKGEMVKVKNLMSRKEIFARVVSSETVRIDL